ncbi:MAG: hypothetical protein HYX33_03065 [Actinobacteria bacterium]|nr:hypothetical protein [Actinomycetota bacterium]
MTTKGASENPDGLGTFRLHWKWASGVAVAMIAGTLLSAPRNDVAMWLWSSMVILLCAIPWLCSRFERFLSPERWNTPDEGISMGILEKQVGS